jgi:hypothetical protein
VVLPAITLLLLVRLVAERIEPGWGTATALTLGLGTLVLPFATVFFSHVLSACLGFAAFALLWRERECGDRLKVLFAAGLLVGFALTVEYSLAIVGLALALYGLVGKTGVVSRALAYFAGAGLGVAPLLVYNRLAFGSIRHVSYVDAVSRPGRSGHEELGANSTGFFGISLPSPRVAVELLFASRGIITLAPVLAMSVVGLVLLTRGGRRAEALTIAFIGLAFLVFNAGYFLPFGGWSPGPRLLVPALPFVALSLAGAYRRYPASTVGLAAASVAVLVTATSTAPLLPDDDTSRWVSRAIEGHFQDSVASLAGAGSGWLVVLPFLMPVAAALLFVVLATPPPAVERRDARAALCLLFGWFLTASLLPLIGHAPGLGAIVLHAWAAVLGALAVGGTMLATRRLDGVAGPAPVHET